MFNKLTLENFKNFEKAELTLGPFTLLIGANATGKSNVREAFRFLHGIGRGYTLPEVIGEKWIEGGVRVWHGIRGGIREIVRLQPETTSPFQFVPEKRFSINASVNVENDRNLLDVTYSIEVAPQGDPEPFKPSIPMISREYLEYDGRKLFHVFRDPDKSSWVLQVGQAQWYDHSVFNEPMLSQTGDRTIEWTLLTSDEPGDDSILEEFREADLFAKRTVDQFMSMRFFDLNPDAMRMPSLPGQDVLGDGGENLSSVLYAICQDPQRKQTLLSWVEELTPMEAIDFEFPADQIGRILLTVVERNGQRTSAYSLSDGTLRFLAILAAFLGPERAKFYFFEELENGIHPTRLHLLTQFIENQVAQGDIQVIASTHSPLLLNYIKPETLEYASLLYRLENQPDAHIKRIVDIPNARQLIEKQGVMRLYESGWFEDVLFLLDGEAPEVEAVA